MTRRQRLGALCAALPLIAVAGAAMLMAQEPPPAAPDRSVEVNGWRVEDVAEPSDDDPGHRVIRMTRGGDYETLVFTVAVSGYRLDGWGDNMFEANATHDGGSCGNGGSVMAETGPPEERAARVRAVLARELGNLERQCGAPRGALQGRLEGFEGGFALLSAWYSERQAELRAVAASAYDETNAAYAYDNAIYYEDGMTMDTNMSMDAGVYDDSYANATVDMNYSEDPEAAIGALEAAADAAEAAIDAAEAALNEAGAQPE